jgi:hypothetical protein
MTTPSNPGVSEITVASLVLCGRVIDLEEVVKLVISIYSFVDKERTSLLVTW